MLLSSKRSLSTLVRCYRRLNAKKKSFYDEELKKLVAQYIVEEMLPINTVDSPSFRAIIKKILTSVNSDANNRSYMGVTLHWISRTTLERHKFALACRRIQIENIHSSYGLLNKVVATVTDNGSNFVKAFQVYHPVTESDDETEEEESTPKDDDVTFSDLSEILSAENESDSQLSLPPHHRCREQGCTCTCIRNSGRNGKRMLLIPTSTRWNSFFDAVKRIAEIPMGELNTVCTKIGLKCFKDQEYQSLHEYCMAMKPLTAALDILQGDYDLSRMTAGLPDAFVQVRSISQIFLERVKQLLTAECCTTAPVAKNPASVPSATTSSSQGEMDFFTFEAEPKEETYSAEKEVMDYLMSGYGLQILHVFKHKDNLGGLVLTPKRNRLSDKRFEKLLLMRYNHWFTRSTQLFPP
uniref:Uncharacterized protein n=1 Tax=Haplochromis burtoni TaxID=8153 RepID=A0A3Q2XDL1_HAPBU